MRDKVIGAGFRALRISKVDRVLSGVTRGLGAILMFHHVRPPPSERTRFAPNQLLEITPEFFETVLEALSRQGFDVVTIDEAAARITTARPKTQRPFAVLTFDDGCRDTRDHALPIMRRHDMPFTMYVTTGFAERRARMWWKELELAIAAAPRVEARIDGEVLALPSGDAAEKTHAFTTLYRYLRSGPEERLLRVIADLCDGLEIDTRAIVELACLDMEEVAAMAREPLCTIGVHTCTHPMLAKHPRDVAQRELAESKRKLEEVCGSARVHLAYPVGDPTSAGTREFAMARDLGFATAVTTRPGMLFPAHAAHLTALPRMSINGSWQDVRHVESLLSGAPFALWNKGRRLNVA